MPSIVRVATKRACSVIFLGLLHLATVGCDGSLPSASKSVRDSAGVTITESDSPRWRPVEAWSVDPEPVLDLATSGTGPSHEFFRVRGAVRLSDGTIAVANSGSSEVRLFSARGRFLDAVGRSGDGPGEFQILSRLVRYRADSMVVFDRARGRVTVLSSDLTHSREFVRPLTKEVHPFIDGSFAAVDDWPSVEYYEGQDELIRTPVPIVRISAVGELLDTLVTPLGNEEYMVMGEYGASSALPLFGKELQVSAFRSQLYIGSSEHLGFEVFSSEGQLLRSARAPGYDLRLSPTDVERERKARLGGGASRSSQLRDIVSRLPTPEARPASSDLKIDELGFVWIAEFKGWSERGEPIDWEVFATDGEWLGTVQVPARFTVFEFGIDYVLGLRLDDDDVEHVQILRLMRGDDPARNP